MPRPMPRAAASSRSLGTRVPAASRPSVSRDETRVASAAWALAPVPPSSRHPVSRRARLPAPSWTSMADSLPLLPLSLPLDQKWPWHRLPPGATVEDVPPTCDPLGAPDGPHGHPARRPRRRRAPARRALRRRLPQRPATRPVATPPGRPARSASTRRARTSTVARAWFAQLRCWELFERSLRPWEAPGWRRCERGLRAPRSSEPPVRCSTTGRPPPPRRGARGSARCRGGRRSGRRSRRRRRGPGR